jgi:hypothetical protein
MKKYRIITKTHDWWSDTISLTYPEMLLIYSRFIDYYIIQKRKFLLFWDIVDVFRTYQEAEEWIKRRENNG